MYESCPSFAIELQVKQCQSACTVSFCNKRMLPCTSRPLRGHGCAVCNRLRGSRDLCSSGRCSAVDRLVTQMVGRCKAPFRLTLRGIITDVSAIQGTVKEDESRLFTLVDNDGSWIKCCAIGMPARSLALVNGNEIVLYFCWGRDNLGTIPGMVYLRKNTFVVLARIENRKYAQKTSN